MSDRTVALALVEPLPADLEVGAPFSLVLALETKTACDLASATFKVFQDEEIVAEGVLPAIVRPDLESDAHDPRNGALDPRDSFRIALIAPEEVGSFQWTIILQTHEEVESPQTRGSLTFSFGTAHHRTSLAAWDVPSPVIIGEKFAVKVGAKCSVCCTLTGHAIELRAEDGNVVAVGELGDRWPGAEGLYWATLEATAPQVQGLCRWSVAFAPSGPWLPHQGSSAAISFVTVAAPRHRVAVTIVEQGSAAPVCDAQVRLGFYRCVTDETGVARFTVAPGEHTLSVWKPSHAAPEQTIQVERDLGLVVEAEALPEEDPYSRWQG